MQHISGWIGRLLGRFLNKTTHVHGTSRPTPRQLLRSSLQPGDVLLVEGQSRVSSAIKYLTQSTWSHAALYIGPEHAGVPAPRGETDPPCFIEADIVDGIRLVGFSEFDGLHSRICRPVGIRATELEQLIAYALARVGQHYDLKNVFDLARYLFPTPPVPLRWRRSMLAFGSGDPTRAICSTLIAQCFQSIRYPILPVVVETSTATPVCRKCVHESLQIRHHSLFVPRDFDVSPYFRVIKPSIENDFDFHQLQWEQTSLARQSMVEGGG